MEKTYTIDQIRNYLKGCLVMQGVDVTTIPNMKANESLQMAIFDLEHEEDGIEATVIRGIKYER